VTKSKSKKQQQAQSQIPTQPSRSGVWRRIPPVVKGASAFLLAVATLLGFVVLPPRISVEKPAESVDVFRPFELPFTVSNDGYFSVYRMTINCIPHELQFRNTPALAAANKNEQTQFNIKNQAFEQIPLLASGERRSFVCDVFHFREHTSVPNNWPLISCDVGVGITFRPIRFIHWRLFRQFLFQASIASDWKLRWHYPLLKQKQATYPPSY
jgi:hypothetical protein